jgi:hypothetical protein
LIGASFSLGEKPEIEFSDIREARKVESIHEKHFAAWKKEGRKPDKNLSLRRLKFMPRNHN